MAPTAFAFPFASFTYEKWRGFHMEKPWERLVGGAVVLGRKASQNGGGHGLQRRGRVWCVCGGRTIIF